ncbi:MAG: nucleotidyltransferase family protein, partial [Clostridia bacterium]|nr:nucleotidyltransferase family protein [Clostridia bacterium]
MLKQIYAMPLFSAFILAVTFISIYAVINALYSKSKWLKAISVSGFLVSLFGIFYITVLSREVGNFSLELRPFYSFVMANEQPEMYRTVFMNVLLYVPFGVFLSYSISRKHKAISVIITVISALIVSVCVEAMQYLYSLGRCEIDDVIFNTLGALWGALGICLFGYLTKELENMKNNLTENQNILCDLCANVLFDKKIDLPKEIDIDELLKEANQQAVFTIAYTALKKLSFKNDFWEKLILHSAMKNARVCYDHIEIGDILTENGIEYVLFKGVASAAYYKKPDIRAMGDVDILINPQDIEKVHNLLLSIGYTTNDDIFKKDNHISYVRHINGVRSVIEVHFKVSTTPDAVADEFDNCFKTVFEDKREISVLSGKCFVPSHFHHGVILLLHTATHLTKEGIGLRHICDWAVFVNSFSNDDFVKTFEAPLKQMGLWRFAQLLTL